MRRNGYFKDYYSKNRDKVLAYRRGWYSKHKGDGEFRKKINNRKKLHYKKNKEILNAKRRAKYIKNKDTKNYYRRRNIIKKRYNITFEQKEQMRISQNNKCNICGDIFKGSKDTCVDHNHETGSNRDLLCKRCNFLLGNANDNKYILQNAIQYLEKWEGQK